MLRISNKSVMWLLGSCYAARGFRVVAMELLRLIVNFCVLLCGC